MPSRNAITLWRDRCQDQEVKNFHLPLPEETYTHLKAVAARARVPATTLAREAINSWLQQQLWK